MFSSLETVIKIALDEAVLTIWDTRIIYFSYSNMRMVLFSFLHARNHWEIAMEMRKTVLHRFAHRHFSKIQGCAAFLFINTKFIYKKDKRVNLA